MIDITRVRRAVRRTARDRDVTGVVLRIDDARDGTSHTEAAGELRADTPFFVASTTKLYTTAIVLRLADRGLLALDDRLADHVDPTLTHGLHVLDGVDHTHAITLRQLLTQTSGLADYFGGAPADGSSLWRALRAGHDRAWTVEDAVAIARHIGPVFPPGAPGRALYSDTNFQLLGRVIERRLGMPYATAVELEVVAPLGLASTWVQTDPADGRAAPLRDGRRQLHIPKAATSFQADGGVVATVDDLMVMLRAFVGGRLFPTDGVDLTRPGNRIFFPFRYGLGVQRFELPRWMSPFSTPPVLVGHSGLSGAFAFHAPDRDVFLAGTVNNFVRPSRSFRLMVHALP